MKIEDLRTLCEAEPFRPFTLQIVGGENLDVIKKEKIIIPPDGKTLKVKDHHHP